MYENNLCETVFEHQHTDTNEQKEKSSVYQNVSVAKPSTSSVNFKPSVSCKPSTPRTSSTAKQSPSKKMYENVAGFSTCSKYHTPN